ncbi:MAG: hypothetical protein BAJATHORv1_60010 [Candidatus Thorarchaeota archaeon]|nr:MAG: hypothetical protein BAJATHORv1_60010 [Candidatus Thorarchaeota archaeon]
MPSVQFTCPICKKTETIEVSEEKIQGAQRNPVPVLVTHGSPEHAVTVFIDKSYNVRATSAADIVQRIQEAEAAPKKYQRRHIPVPKQTKVPLDDLDNAQVTIVALADGEKSVAELAQILDIPAIRVKILCEQLVKLERLESVKTVVE